MIFAALLLLTPPLSAAFFTLYAFCGLTDVLDGFVARRLHCATARGAALDSVADFVFIAVAMLTLIPALPWQRWMLFWVLGIAVIRFVSLGTGWVRFRALSFLHTIANKMAGAVLFLMPLLIPVWGLAAPAAIGCAIASLAALEEYLLILRCPSLDRNAKGLFWKKC